MTASDWINSINDITAEWYSILSNRQVPIITTAQTNAAIALEQTRQANNTILMLGLLAIGAYAITRK